MWHWMWKVVKKLKIYIAVYLIYQQFDTIYFVLNSDQTEQNTLKNNTKGDLGCGKKTSQLSLFVYMCQKQQKPSTSTLLARA